MDLHFFISVAHAADAASSSGNPAAVFGLNVQLFVAQLINFGVILFILWKWVFTPVAKKLQERSDKIQKSMSDAERVAKEKQEFELWRQTEMGKTRQESSAIVTAAQNDAVKAKQQIMDQVKADQQKIVDQAKAQIESEKNKSILEAKSELANLVTSATEKILRQKLDTKADQELIKESLWQIK